MRKIHLFYKNKGFYFLLLTFFLITAASIGTLMLQEQSSNQEIDAMIYNSQMDISEKIGETVQIPIVAYEQAARVLVASEELQQISRMQVRDIAYSDLETLAKTLDQTFPIKQHTGILYFERSNFTVDNHNKIYSSPYDALAASGITDAIWDNLVRPDETFFATITTIEETGRQYLIAASKIYNQTYLVFILPKDMLNIMLAGTVPNDETTVVIAAENNHAIVSPKTSELSFGNILSEEEINALSTQGTIKIKQKEYNVLLMKDNNTKLRVFTLFPASEPHAGMLSGAGLIIALLASLLVTYMLSLLIYRYFRRSKEFDTITEAKYKQLEQRHTTLFQENQETLMELTVKNTLLRNSILFNLINGGKVTPGLKHTLASLGFDLEKKLYAVISIDTTGDITGLYNPQAEGENEDFSDGISDFRSACEGIASEKGFSLFILDNFSYLLGFVLVDNSENEEQSKEKVAQFTQTLNNQYDLDLIVTASHFYSELDSMKWAYVEAVNRSPIATELREYSPTYLAPQKFEPQDSTFQFLDACHSLVQYLKNNKIDMAFSIVQNLIDNLPAQVGEDMQKYNMRIFYMLYSILFSLAGSHSPASANLMNIIHTFSLNPGKEKVTAVYEDLKEVMVSMHRTGSAKPAEPKNKIEELYAYINNNYQNPNLSSAMIAEFFGMSAPALTALFKRETGAGILDYIHMVRLNYAKQLINETSITIHDVATKVGYGNFLTMHRAFKRYEGVTPGSFRKAEG